MFEKFLGASIILSFLIGGIILTNRGGKNARRQNQQPLELYYNMATTNAYDAKSSTSHRRKRRWYALAKLIPEDKIFLSILLIACFASVAAFLYFYSQGDTLMYGDAKSHQLIAKRVIHSPTPGFGQLGAVWPFLPHVLMLPFVWNDTLFYTGMAGSFISMTCFVGTAAYIFKITQHIGGGRKGGATASLLFITQPDILYMQATPMSELPLFLFMAASIYYFLRWTQDTERHLPLFGSGLFLCLATLTRYEAWVLLAILSVVLVGICWKRFSLRESEAHLIWFGTVACIGIAIWVGWNTAIFSNPFYFQYGEYAKPSLWTGEGELAVGNLEISLLTYWYGMLEIFRLPLVLLMSIGAVYLPLSLLKKNKEQTSFSTLIRPWRHFAIQNQGHERLIILTLLFPVPFFIMALYQGQRPMHVEQITGDLYNVRFALILILAMTVLLGFMARRYTPIAIIILGVAVTSTTIAFYQDDIVTLADPRSEGESESSERATLTASWLRENYDDGYVLMESFGNELLQFDSHIPTTHLLYEGSYLLWEPALEHPDRYVTWVVMRYGDAGSDKVSEAVGRNPHALSGFELVFENEAYRIYRWRD